LWNVQAQTSVAPGVGELTGLIDAHCHIFNASDVPVYNYLRTVIFDLYDDQTKIVDGVPPVTVEPKCREEHSGHWLR
jgi:hypothetical protein